MLQCYFKVIYLVTSCRNYHVFYYLLAGASPEVKEELHLTKPEEYCYLNQVFFTSLSYFLMMLSVVVLFDPTSMPCRMSWPSVFR